MSNLSKSIIVLSLIGFLLSFSAIFLRQGEKKKLIAQGLNKEQMDEKLKNYKILIYIGVFFMIIGIFGMLFKFFKK